MNSGVIAIDKPENLTSFDVVAKCRRIFSTKKIGHSGTLDPMATGVLPVFVGGATKAADCTPEIPGQEKAYTAHFRLGVTTDTQDITGKILTESGRTATSDELNAVVKRFTGRIRQLPPMFSAVQINGVRLYDLARKGIEVERKLRDVNIRSLEILDFDGVDGALQIECSKGTYVRTLIHDIGQALNTGAVMTALRRTRSGIFTIENSVKLQTLIELSESGADVNTLLTPLEAIFSPYPQIRLDEKQSALFANGVKLDPARLLYTDGGSADVTYTVMNNSGRLIALARLTKTSENPDELAIIRRFRLE
jgi:tRNA pseudouridine55 synthase